MRFDRWDIALRLIFVRLWANSERLSVVGPIGLKIGTMGDFDDGLSIQVYVTSDLR